MLTTVFSTTREEKTFYVEIMNNKKKMKPKSNSGNCWRTKETKPNNDHAERTKKLYLETVEMQEILWKKAVYIIQKKIRKKKTVIQQKKSRNKIIFE